MIYEGIVHGAKQTTAELGPSTSKEQTLPQEFIESEFILDWSDFSEEFTLNDPLSTPSNEVECNFTTPNCGKIIAPSNGRAESSTRSSNKSFYSKPPIKLNFNNQTTSRSAVQPPLNKKRDQLEHSTMIQNQDTDDVAYSAMSKHFNLTIVLSILVFVNVTQKIKVNRTAKKKKCYVISNTSLSIYTFNKNCIIF